MKNKKPWSWSLYRVSYVNHVLGNDIKVTRDFEAFDKAMDYMMEAKAMRKGRDYVIEKITTSHEIVARG